MDQWFYLEADGSQRGPLTLDQLVAALRSRSPQTQVWRSGLAQWVAADSIPELRAAWGAPAAPAPTAPPPQISAPVRPAMPRPQEDNPWISPGARPVGMTPGEESTLNPWTLFKRSFFPRGRFGRGEFAIAYFTPLLAALLLYLVGFFLALLLGAKGGKAGGGAAGVVLLLTMAPAGLLWLVSLYTNFVSSMRRAMDRGNSPWLALLMLVPCVNLIMICYLLFAPTKDAEAEQVLATANPVPVLVTGLLAVPGFACIAGVIAAIAIPSLLRARVSANEAATIGDIRTVISAQSAYQSANQGLYDTMPCLATPANCIPNYTGPTFIDPALASATLKNGYRRTFHPGPASGQRPSGTSPSSLDQWAYVAVPASNQTGVRAFCGDFSGIILFTPDGSEPPVSEGKCDQNAQTQPLR